MTENGALFVGQLTARMAQITRGTLSPQVWVHTSIGYQGSSDFKVEIRTSPRDKQSAVIKTYPYEKYFTEEGRFLTNLFTTDSKNVLPQLLDSKKSN